MLIDMNHDSLITIEGGSMEPCVEIPFAPCLVNRWLHPFVAPAPPVIAGPIFEIVEDRAACR